MSHAKQHTDTHGRPCVWSPSVALSILLCVPSFPPRPSLARRARSGHSEEPGIHSLPVLCVEFNARQQGTLPGLLPLLALRISPETVT